MIKIEMFLIIKIMKNSISVWDKRKIAFFIHLGQLPFVVAKLRHILKPYFKKDVSTVLFFYFLHFFVTFVEKKNLIENH